MKTRIIQNFLTTLVKTRFSGMRSSKNLFQSALSSNPNSLASLATSGVTNSVFKASTSTTTTAPRINNEQTPNTNNKNPLKWLTLLMGTGALLYFYNNDDDHEAIHRAIENGNLLDAITLCNLRLKDHPRDLDIYLIKSVCLGRQGRHEEAKAVCEEALKIDIKNHQARLNLTIAMTHLGDYKMAIGILNALISEINKENSKENPSDNPTTLEIALAHRAYCHWKIGNFKSALADCEILKALNYHHPDPQIDNLMSDIQNDVTSRAPEVKAAFEQMKENPENSALIEVYLKALEQASVSFEETQNNSIPPLRV